MMVTWAWFLMLLACWTRRVITTDSPVNSWRGFATRDLPGNRDTQADKSKHCNQLSFRITNPVTLVCRITCKLRVKCLLLPSNVNKFGKYAHILLCLLRSLFIDAFSVTEYTTSNEGIKRERWSEKCVGGGHDLILRHYPRICVKELKIAKKILNHHSRSPDRDIKLQMLVNPPNIKCH
jgi:hypothetical protein